MTPYPSLNRTTTPKTPKEVNVSTYLYHMFVADLLRTYTVKIQEVHPQSKIVAGRQRNVTFWPCLTNQKRSTRIRHTLIRYLPSEPQPTAMSRQIEAIYDAEPRKQAIHNSSTPSTTT